MADVRRSPQSESDLDHILSDLNEINPAIADRYANEFAEKVLLLSQFPELGRTCPEIADNLRSTLVHPYVLFYRIVGDEVQILRILHGKQDLRRVMRQDPNKESP